jgi:hypothetical protein
MAIALEQHLGFLKRVVGHDCFVLPRADPWIIPIPASAESVNSCRSRPATAREAALLLAYLPRIQLGSDISLLARRVGVRCPSALWGVACVDRQGLDLRTSVWILVRAVLALEDVANGRFEAAFVVDVPTTSSFRPPISPSCSFWFVSQELIQFPGAPGLELFANFIGVAIGGDHHVHVIGAAVHGVQMPTSDLTMIRNGSFDEATLLPIEGARILGHLDFRFELPDRTWVLPTMSIFRPPAFIAGKPSSVSSSS